MRSEVEPPGRGTDAARMKSDGRQEDLVCEHEASLREVEAGEVRSRDDGDGVAPVEVFIGEAPVLTAEHDGHCPLAGSLSDLLGSLAWAHVEAPGGSRTTAG